MDVVKSLSHPEEVVALFKFKMGKCESVKPKRDKNEMTEDLKKCYIFLGKTSRSFAAVIQALDEELRNAVCIFYLVLRALDTVEDDMTIPLAEKIPILQRFHTYLLEPEWRYMESQEKDRMVLEEFPVISAEFRKLAPIYRDVISDICHKMGCGMVKYLEKAPGSMQEWDEYCHYVAGLVGLGLSRLFSASDLESPEVGRGTRLSNSMGLFLQKTNIIRDYHEDIMDNREFWPNEAWGKYTKKLQDFAEPSRIHDAVSCLNELITHALHHVPDVLSYLEQLQNQSVFNFCAIPQVMAIATLERCYNNPSVFRGVVKIRKGEAVRLMMEATSIGKVRAIFRHFLEKIQSRVPNADASATHTREVVADSLRLTDTVDDFKSSTTFLPVYASCLMLTSAIVWQYWTALTSAVGSWTLDS